MVSKFLLSVLLGGTVLLLSGCADGLAKKEPSWEAAQLNPFVPANYKAADALMAQLSSVVSKRQSLIVTTVVSIDALEKSSTMGRLISEQIAGRFTQSGYRMVEMKFGNAVYVKRDQGELMLTREINDLAKNYDAQAVIVGTYGESADFVFVNLKVIQPTTNVVLAVHDYVLPLDSTVRSMLPAKRSRSY